MRLERYNNWARLNDPSCPSTKRQVNEIFTSTEFPDYAIVPYRDASFEPSHGVVSSPETGVYLLNLQTNTCQNLVGGTEVRAPAHVTLARLSDTARVVVILHDVEGYTHCEIADLMGKSSSFSKSQLARAHQRLQQAARAAEVEIDECGGVER